MFKHTDPEVQFVVEILQEQRDSAVAQAAAFFRVIKELEKQVEDLNKIHEEQKLFKEKYGDL